MERQHDATTDRRETQEEFTMEQEQGFESALQQIPTQERESVMEIVTSWGKKAECKLVLLLLRKQRGDTPPRRMK